MTLPSAALGKLHKVCQSGSDNRLKGLSLTSLSWISTVFIISLLLAYGWMNCRNEKKIFEANDIKYRFWKANGNASLLKIIYLTDSIYNLDKDDFINGVLHAELKIAEQEKMHPLADEKKKTH
jgi:hypothetical protein